MTERSFDDYARFIRRNAGLIILVAVITGLIAFAVSLSQPSKYRASSKILVSATSGDTISSNEDPTRIIDTLVKLAKSDDVLTYAAAQGGVSKTALEQTTGVSGSATADVVTVTATERSAKLAATYANALSSGFVRWREKQTRDQTQARISVLQRQLAALGGQSTPSAVAAASDVRTQLSQAQAELQVPNSDLVIISPATSPTSRFAPSPARNGILALIAGLFLGLALSAIRERADRRIRSDDELEEIYGAPILGRMPYVAGARHGERTAALADFATASPLADSFRTIRTNVSLFRRIETETQVILVTSAVAGEGKTPITANLARAFAVSGQRVLAISGDVHSPMLHLVLTTGTGGATPVGIVEVLADDLPLATSVRTHRVLAPDGRAASVSVLANARRFPDPSILYQSEVMEKLLDAARKSFDVILMDSPPLLANAESALLATRADGFILASRAGMLTRVQARQAAKTLEAAALRPLGIVVTGRPTSEGAYYGYGYGDAEPAASRPAGDPGTSRWRRTRRGGNVTPRGGIEAQPQARTRL
jgi:capsular exopolysaccharide synthesis family protein